MCAALGPDVRCWGSGEFGDGVARSRVLRPLGVPELAHLDDLALGDAHSCALRSGEVRCWGSNERGQLGNGEGGCRYTRERCPQRRCLPPRECKHEPSPVVAAGLPPIVELRVGGAQTHARDADGRIWVSGQQGTSMDYGGDNPQYRMRVVEGLPPMVELAAGGSHACARTAAGEVWCWGVNAFGQLGRPPAGRGGAEAPGRVPGLPPASRLALGSHFSCAITGEGAAAAVWCWGDNGVGQLGDGTTERRHAPTRVRWE